MVWQIISILYSTLLRSTLVYPTLCYSTLPYSALSYSDIIYSTRTLNDIIIYSAELMRTRSMP